MLQIPARECSFDHRVGFPMKAPIAIVATALTLAINGCVPLFLSAQQAAIKLAPSSMSKVGEVDARFSSYNVEMVEVTGGRFWKPYKSAASAAAAKPAASDTNQQVGVNPALFQNRQPINLANPRLRKLAEALGPAYVRVSGSWANSTFFQDNDQPAPSEAPKGFKGILTRAEWKGVVDFARATGGEIVTSFAISPGTRDAQGVWTPEQAKAFLDYTKSIGGTIAATEFMNEPTFPGPGGGRRVTMRRHTRAIRNSSMRFSGRSLRRRSFWARAAQGKESRLRPESSASSYCRRTTS